MEIDTDERLRRRVTFDAIPDIYDSGRPSYPGELYDDLLSKISGVGGAPPQVLEVGCGTGQASRSLLERGCTVAAVELGPSLAAKARANLSTFERRFQVIVGDFEKVLLPAHSFDIVASASAFHWIDPVLGFSKAVDLLRPSGMIALWGMGEQSNSSETDFATEVRAIYDQLEIPRRTGRRPGGELERPRSARAIEESGVFGSVEIRRYPCDLAYSREQYLNSVSSYSRFQILPPSLQNSLTDRIGLLIEDRYGGSVVRRALATLCFARPLRA
jgi:SAM-dependent methyltransferase